MREIIITANDAGQRLDRFLSKSFPSLSQGVIRSALRKNKIKLNGKRPPADIRLEKGDVLRLYMDELIEKKKPLTCDIPRDLNIIYEDDNLLILDKPAGLPVHEDNDHSPDTLINRVLLYLGVSEADLSFRPALCNRIDRNTGGIVLAAKNAESLRIISQKLKHREITRLYLCAVHGVPTKKSATLTAELEKFPDKNIVRVSNKKTFGSKPIRTAYRVLDTRESCSLLEVNLLTGRTHQIRAHMAFIGHPLLGDGKYGRASDIFKYQALYSYKLRFDFTSEAGILDYLNGKEFETKDVWFLEKYYEIFSSAL